MKLALSLLNESRMRALFLVVLCACGNGLIIEPFNPGGGSAGGQGGGSGVGGGDSSGGGHVSQYACDATKPSADAPLRRLSKLQYARSVESVLRASLPQTDADDVWAQVQDALSEVPDDGFVAAPTEAHGGYRRLDQTIQGTAVEGWYGVAAQLATLATSTPARLTSLVGNCSDAACRDNFLQTFGARALRRPLSADDLTFYRTVLPVPLTASGVAGAITVLLSSPRFLYLVEETDLDAYALASRVSYLFWQGPPDDALLASAADGSLLTDDSVYSAQVHRVFDDARTEQGLREFFSDWLRLQETPQFNTSVGTPAFDALFGALTLSDATTDHVNEDVLAMAMTVKGEGGTVGSLLTDNRSFAKDADAAALNGMPVLNGAAQPFTDSKRAGLITRVAFTASGSVGTRPIEKGFKIRSALLCDPIQLSNDPDIIQKAAMGVPDDPTLTTRERVEQLTQQDGSPCASCHVHQVNPMGFATEDFDGLGRTRATEWLFDGNGTKVGEKAVNTIVFPFLNPAHDTQAQGAGDVTAQLAASGRFETCFAREWYRFSFQRIETYGGADGCVMSELEQAAWSGEPLGQVMLRAALRPEFRHRTLP